MPVDIDRFERGTAGRDPTTSERVLRFLAAHDAEAFTRREIAEAVDRDPETVGTNLTRLKDRGLVRHRAPYWAFTDDREHARTVLEARYDDEFVASVVRAVEPDEPVDDDHGEATAVHRRAARDFFDRVRRRLGDAVEALYLFGSVAREAETAASDVDVLAVVADDADYAAVDDVLLELAYAVQLEYGVRVEVHSIRAGEFATRRERGDPFVRSVLAEAETSG